MGFHTKVFGVTHDNPTGVNRQELVQNCWTGQSLALIAEPKNPYDKNAIAVYDFEGHHLGYLSSEIAEQFADEGWNLKDWGAAVTEVTGGTAAKSHFGLNIYLFELKEIE